MLCQRGHCTTTSELCHLKGCNWKQQQYLTHGRKFNMLVLSRKKYESIVIGDNIVLKVMDIRDGKVRLGIEAPREIPVHREEVATAVARQKAQEATPSEPSATDRPTC